MHTGKCQTDFSLGSGLLSGVPKFLLSLKPVLSLTSSLCAVGILSIFAAVILADKS